MSFPDSQALVPSLEKIIEGITALKSAIMERHRAPRSLHSKEAWSEPHLQELAKLYVEISDLEFRMIKLKNESR